MNDVKRINEFLELMVYCANNGYDINREMVYANLIRIGVSKEDRKHYVLDDNFDYWIDCFKNSKNITVFNSEFHKYFCQFINKNNDCVNDVDKIKMYIPLDKEHIREGARRIFSFLEQENIAHLSKIGKDVRFDDIVVRIGTKEDAYRLEEFVLNDPYIREGMIKPNPFAFNDGYVTYAWDGELSYNETVSSIISGYINELKDNGRLEQAEYSDFYKYIGKLYVDAFEDGHGLNDLIYRESKRINGEDYEIIRLLVNYESVMKLMMAAMVPDKKMREFYECYYLYTSTDYQLSSIDRIRNLYNKINGLENEYQEVRKKSREEELQVMWNDVYNSMINKHGCDEALARTIKFIETGNLLLFSREENMREKIIDSKITPDELRNVMITMNQYIDKGKSLKNASYETMEKYGNYQVCGAIAMASRGNFGSFTNTNGVRKDLEKMVKKEEIDIVVVCDLLRNGYDPKLIFDKFVSDKKELYEMYVMNIEREEKKSVSR